MTITDSTRACEDNNIPAPFFAKQPLPYALGKPLLSADLKQQPNDFFVEEVLGFLPEGEGEHVFLWIEKKGMNTQQVVDNIARLAAVRANKVSYSGMKDRQAVTRQWFSVHLPGKQVFDWQALNSDNISVLKVERHLRKLRRGVHKANRFVITLKHLQASDIECALEDLKSRIELIQQRGFPNYFGEQRFGRGGMNLLKAKEWFEGGFSPKRHLRGIYLSAVRSSLFNLVLAERVKNDSWCCSLPGELYMLEGTNSVFQQAPDETLSQRLLEGDIHLTGPLYGKDSGLKCESDVADIEARILSSYRPMTEGLERFGLKAERRALRVLPTELAYELNDDQLILRFILPTGCFATSLIRELVDYSVSNEESR